MSTIHNAFVIKVDGKVGGLVRRESRGFRFIATDGAFSALDQKRFASPAKAELAVRRIGRTKEGAPKAVPARGPAALIDRVAALFSRSHSRSPSWPGLRLPHASSERPRPNLRPSAAPRSSAFSEREAASSRSQALAIVGAGFSGTLLALHLSRHDRFNRRIHLFEQRASFGPGLAYSTGNPSHRVNTRAINMSAFPDRPDHFVEWLADHARRNRLEQPTGYSFVTRRVFGSYIESLLRAQISDNTTSGRLFLVADEVVDLGQDGDLVSIRTAGGRTYTARRVVLATGNPAPGRNDGAYFGDPWDPAAVAGLSPDGAVLLMGTGLTMVDVVQSLLDVGHTGPIIAISRRGLLPRVHTRAEPLRLDRDEIPETASLAELTVWFRRQLAKAEADGADWRSVIDGVRPHVSELWAHLPIDARRRFLRHLRPYWDVHRHRLSPQVNALFQDALARGQLTVHAGRIVELRPDTQTATVRFRRRGVAAVEETLRVDRVIDCTGPATAYRGGVSPVIDSLLSRGWARPDPLNLGLEVDQHGALVQKDGTPSSRVFAVGPLTRGSFWESVAVPDIRAHCARLADHLASLALVTR
ncbi:MAG: FAD/NAD(P)-binding protein [Rhodospirillales bacterium]|nr:FAD/NAD(P)-binding protein [Rhodospirillales bacterium]